MPKNDDLPITIRAPYIEIVIMFESMIVITHIHIYIYWRKTNKGPKNFTANVVVTASGKA